MLLSYNNPPVNNMTQPQIKEKKLSKSKLPRPKISCRACDHCQKYRSRCDGTPDKPCTACSTKHIECTFLTPRRKRGPKPKNLSTPNTSQTHLNPITTTNSLRYSHDSNSSISMNRSYTTHNMNSITKIEHPPFYYPTTTSALLSSALPVTPSSGPPPAMLTTSSSPISTKSPHYHYHYHHDVQSLNLFMDVLQPHLCIMSHQELYHRMTTQFQSIYFDFLLHTMTCSIQVWMSHQSQLDGSYQRFNRCIEEFYKLSPPPEFDQDYSRASQLLSMIQSQLMRRSGNPPS